MSRNLLLIAVTYLTSLHCLKSQTIIKLVPDNQNYRTINVVDITSVNDLGPTSLRTSTAINVIDGSSSQLGFAIVPNVVNTTTQNTAVFISSGKNKLELIRLLQINGTDYFCAGNLTNANSQQEIFFGVLNTVNQKSEIKSFVLDGNPTGQTILKDIVRTRDSGYVLLCENIIPIGPTEIHTVVVVKLKDERIEWTNQFIHRDSNAIADLYPLSIFEAPDRYLYVSGTTQSLGTSNSNMLLCQIDPLGQMSNAIEAELTVAGTASPQRFGYVRGHFKTDAIHLVAQAVARSSDPGTILFTWFDNTLTLRTWRNYMMPLRLEASMMSPTHLYLSGQARDGFVQVVINSSNAIPELMSRFEPGLNNVSIATSSAIKWERAGGRIMSAVKPNGSATDFLSYLSQDATTTNNCATEFTHTVAKDPIVLKRLNIFPNPPTVSSIQDVDLEFSSIIFFAENICPTTSTDDISNSNVNISPNPSRNGFQITSEQVISKIRIRSLDGKLISEIYSPEQSEIHFSTIGAGVFILETTFKNGERKITRIIKVDG